MKPARAKTSKASKANTSAVRVPAAMRLPVDVLDRIFSGSTPVYARQSAADHLRNEQNQRHREMRVCRLWYKGSKTSTCNIASIEQARRLVKVLKLDPSRGLRILHLCFDLDIAQEGGDEGMTDQVDYNLVEVESILDACKGLQTLKWRTKLIAKGWENDYESGGSAGSDMDSEQDREEIRDGRFAHGVTEFAEGALSRIRVLSHLVGLELQLEAENNTPAPCDIFELLPSLPKLTSLKLLGFFDACSSPVPTLTVLRNLELTVFLGSDSMNPLQQLITSSAATLKVLHITMTPTATPDVVLKKGAKAPTAKWTAANVNLDSFLINLEQPSAAAATLDSLHKWSPGLVAKVTAISTIGAPPGPKLFKNYPALRRLAVQNVQNAKRDNACDGLLQELAALKKTTLRTLIMLIPPEHALRGATRKLGIRIIKAAN